MYSVDIGKRMTTFAKRMNVKRPVLTDINVDQNVKEIQTSPVMNVLMPLPLLNIGVSRI